MRPLPLALLATLVMGCAPSHKVTLEEMQTSPTCHFWARGIGTTWGTVENGQAHLNGSFAPKQPMMFTSPTEIDLPGAWVKHPVGRYENHTLNVWNQLEVPITEHQSVVPGMLGGMKVEYNDKCSDRDAALGVALMVLAAAASSH
jgi:hypothetical protein